MAEQGNFVGRSSKPAVVTSRHASSEGRRERSPRRGSGGNGGEKAPLTPASSAGGKAKSNTRPERVRKVWASDRITRSMADTISRQKGEVDVLKDLVGELEAKVVEQQMKVVVEKTEVAITEKEAFESCRQYLRVQFSKFMGHPKRLELVKSNFNYCVGKFKLEKYPDHATKLEALFYEEAKRKLEVWSAQEQKDHDEYHQEVLDLEVANSRWWTRAKRYTVYTAASLAVGAVALASAPVVVTATVVGTAMSAGVVAKSYFTTKIRGGVLDIRRVREVMDTCVEGCPLLEMEPGSVFIDNNDGVCRPRSYLVGFTICFDNLTIYRSCHHNEKVAVVNRQLLRKQATPGIRLEAWTCAAAKFMETEFFRSLPDFADARPELMEEFLARYGAGRRKALLNSVHRADYNTSFKCQCFVKFNEWLARKVLEKSHPRLISSYDNGFLLNSITFWQWSKQVSQSMSTSIDREYTFSSGLSPLEIGDWVCFREALGFFFYEGDASRLDGSTCVPARQAQLEFYRAKQADDESLRLFTGTLSTEGRTSHGYEFVAEGTIGSGRIDTNLGDSFVTAASIEYAKDGAIAHALITGDDNVLASPQPISASSFVDSFWRLGYKLDFIPRPDVDYLEYCSGRFWRFAPGRRCLGPKLGRVLGKSLMPHSVVPVKKLYDHLRSVVRSYYHYRWLPGLDVLMEQFGVNSFSDSKQLEFKVHLKEDLPCIDEGEVEDHFQKVYGFTGDALREVLRAIPFASIADQGGLCVTHPILTRLAEIDGMVDPELGSKMLGFEF